MSDFVSYAQNFEDVMLWRALKHISHGYYVDVGANDPKFDSVTYAFYERGWRGINIEPMPSYYEALCQERPRDINLPYAVGASEGELTLFEVPETGISSIIRDAVYNNKYLNERTIIERKVLATTLDKIFDEYVHTDIHFLKIDVEGFERPVLEGLSLRKWRPWILIVEANLPNSPLLNKEFPEDIIVSSGYTFVYYDGLNRFYIAEEHSELREAFSSPPNVFDYFALNSQIKANSEIEALRSTLQQANSEIETHRSTLQQTNSEIEMLRSTLQQTQNEINALRAETEWARTDLSYLRSEIGLVRAERDAFRAKNELIEKQLAAHQVVAQELNHIRVELDVKRAEAETLRREYINVLYSLSYRITAPLRMLYTHMDKLRNRLGITKRHSPKENQVAQTPPANAVFINLEQTNNDEQRFLNFFQREINERQKVKKDKKL